MKNVKEVTIVKDKFQEFRRNILANLGAVLKIVFGDKYLVYQFDTKKYMDYKPKNITVEEYAMNMVERDIHEVYNLMTKGHVLTIVGNQLEKKDLTGKYRVCTIENINNNTQKNKMKDGVKEMVRLTKKDLMEQIKIMRNDLVNGWIDKAVDNCGSYNRINKDVVSYWGIEKEVYDYELKLKECTLLKTPAFKKEVAKYLENDFDIRGVRIVVGGVFGTAEVLVDVEDVKNGKLVEVCYLWDNNCNYSIHRELEKQYPNARAEFEEKEQQAMFNKGRELVIGLKNAKKEEVAKVLDEVFMSADMQLNKFDTIADCLSDARTELGGLVVKRLEEMVQDCLEKDKLKRKEESVLEFAIDSMLDITDELYNKIEVIRFKTQGILPEYESFIEEGVIYKTVDENKVAVFNEYNLNVTLDHKEKEVVIYDVVKQIEGQVDLVSYEKSMEKSEKLESPKKKIEKEVITFDVDGESSSYITEKKDVDYATAQKEYRLRLQSAPEETYNKTNFDLKINGECVYGFRVDLCKGFDHKLELADELLRNLKFQKRVWTGEEYSWMQGEYREKRIKEQFGTEEEMIKFFDKIEEILVGFGTPEPAPNSKELVEVVVEKMEEKEMNTINKNTLTNRMTKLGEFLKENRDKDVVENKVYELFPKAIEVEVFNGDDVVYFLVGQDYVGKEPTRKEMKEQDNLFKEIDKMYGLSVYVSVNEEKIKIESSVGVDYRDIYNHTHYTDCTVKEIEIELDLTMEVAKELAEDIREQNDKGTLNTCYSWNRINDLCKRNTTDEVLDFLESEKQYYNKKEEEERKQKNIEYINKTINTSYQLFAEGTISVEKILEKLKKLEGYCHEYALLKKVEDARKLFERAEDSMWREVVRKEVVKILEEKYNQMLQEKIEILEKEVTSETTAEDAKEILGKLGKHIKKLYDIEHNGFCYETEPLLVTCYGVGGKENIPNGCDKVIQTNRLRYGIHLSKSEEFISMYVVGDILVEKDNDTKLYENRRIFYKEIPLSIEKQIENHINEVLELSIKENNSVGYMYKKTIAVKKNDEYEFTSLFEDVWTGQDVYIGNGANMIMIPNSSKSFLTDIVEDYLCNNINIDETVKRIEEKIKKKFEYSYSKSTTVKEEEEVYVLKTPSDVELFWHYKDAYDRMVELVNEMSEKFLNNYKVTMDDYSARMETFSWKITTKKVK